jgi:hypothetical protein
MIGMFNDLGAEDEVKFLRCFEHLRIQHLEFHNSVFLGTGKMIVCLLNRLGVNIDSQNVFASEVRKDLRIGSGVTSYVQSGIECLNDLLSDQRLQEQIEEIHSVAM